MRQTGHSDSVGQEGSETPWSGRGVLDLKGEGGVTRAAPSSVTPARKGGGEGGGEGETTTRRIEGTRCDVLWARGGTDIRTEEETTEGLHQGEGVVRLGGDESAFKGKNRG